MAISGGLGLQQVQRLPSVLRLPRALSTGGVSPFATLLNGQPVFMNGQAILFTTAS